jgi:hypothetical protein
MYRRAILRPIACLLVAVLSVSGPPLLLAGSCCNQTAGLLHGASSCPHCTAHRANRGGRYQMPQVGHAPVAAKSCCRHPETRAEQPNLPVGLTCCDCCDSNDTVPAVPAPLAADLVGFALAASIPGGIPLANLADSSAGQLDFQLETHASLLDRSRQVLFCTWRP